ncbi:hypothetical protein ES708_17535 [subsurface metagenome]
MKKFIIFLLLVIIIFSFFMHDIGGLRVRRAKAEKGKKIGNTVIVLDWNKLSEWWQEKRKSVFKRKKELQRPKKDLEKSL